MTNTTDVIIVTSEIKGMVSDEARLAISYSLLIITSSCVCSFGVIANVINIVVYSKQGIKDSITVQFLSLSISDLVYCIFTLTSSLSNLVNKVKPDLTLLDPLDFLYVLGPFRNKIYAISILVTMVMSIERCCCVVLPFTVKTVFTKTRSVAGVIIITVSCTSWMIPELTTIGLEWRHDPEFNKTRIRLWQAANRVNYEVAETVVFSGILPVVAGVTMTTCASLMIVALRISTKLRQSSAPSRSSDNRPNVSAISNVVTSGTTNMAAEGQRKKRMAKSREKVSKSMKALPGRDARLVKTVVAVDFIFIFFNIPKCFVVGSTIAKYFVPEFSYFVHGKYDNLVAVFTMFTYTSESFNASINLIIYYVASLKFRSTFWEVFFCGEGQKATEKLRT